jgi:hypothetical protein
MALDGMQPCPLDGSYTNFPCYRSAVLPMIPKILILYQFTHMQAQALNMQEYLMLDGKSVEDFRDIIQDMNKITNGQVLHILAYLTHHASSYVRSTSYAETSDQEVLAHVFKYTPHKYTTLQEFVESYETPRDDTNVIRGSIQSGVTQTYTM